MRSTSRPVLRPLAAFALSALIALPCAAQVQGPPWVSLDTRIWPSPRASVSQAIGVCEITVRYSRPAVKEREIWGELVPYDRVWRAGADQNTTVELSEAMRIDGQTLEAGRYGLHILPGKEHFTVIFSRFADAWGSFAYDPTEDVLRVEVEPKEASHREWLSYEFSELSSESAVLSLRWQSLELPLRIEVDTHAIALARFRDGFRSLSGFTWMGYANAARYCLDNEVALEEGLGWAQKALEEQVSYDTLALEALLLDRLGQKAEADAGLDRAIELATPRQARFLAGRLLRSEEKGRAVRLLGRMAERYPEDWRMHYFHGRALVGSDFGKRARVAFDRALELAPEPQKAAVREQIAAL